MALPKSIGLSSKEAGEIDSIESARKFSLKMVQEFDYQHRKLRNAPAHMIKTRTWEIYEDENGDLKIRKWKDGDWVYVRTFTVS